MDPNAKDCIAALIKRLGRFGQLFDNQTKQSEILFSFEDYSNRIQNANKKLLDIDPNSGLTYFDVFVREKLDEITIEITKRSQTDIINELKFREMTKSIEDNAKLLEPVIPDGTDKKGNKIDRSKLRYTIAYNSTIFNTNKTMGHATLEGLIDSETKGITGGMLYRLKQEFPEAENLVKLVKDINDKEFFDEYFHLISNFDKNRNVILTNEKTHKIAKIILEEVGQIPYYKLLQMGRLDQRPLANRLKIAFEISKMKSFKDVDDFANFLAPLLSSKHGDELARIALSKRIYKKFHEDGLHDWRSVDRAVRESYDEIVTSIKNEYIGIKNPAALEIKNNRIAQVADVLTYKDGQSFISVRDRLGIDTNITTLLYRSINESGRILGLTRMFGPNWQTGFDRLNRWAKEKTNNFENAPYVEKKIAAYTEEYVNHLINPYIAENSYLSVWGNSLRQLQNVKLGGALLTNIGDIATFTYSGLTKLGSTPGRLISAVFNAGDEFRGTKAERQAYNGMIVDFSEMFVTSSQDRFRLNDNYGASASSSILNGFGRFSATMSHIALEWTGFNWWNRSMGSGAAAVVAREIGDHIKFTRAWNDLTDIQRANYTRFGIFENEYKELLARRPLDDSGRLNIFALRDEIGINSGVVGAGLEITGRGTETLQIKSATLQNKLIMMINDMVEKMVIKPSALDRATTGFFSKPGSAMEQFFKSIMQFKSYMVSFSRKMLLSEMYETNGNWKKWSTIRNLAGLYASMYVLSYITVQGKQVVQGKQPYNTEEAMIRTLQYTNFIPIIGDYLWENGGSSLWNSMFGDGKEPPPTVEKFLANVAGPVIGDFLTLAFNAVNVGRGAILDLRDVENDKIWRQHLSNFTRTAGELIPFYHMWYTQAIWRSQLHDRIIELIDPRGYRRYQRRQIQNAREERSGGTLYNSYGKIFRSD